MTLVHTSLLALLTIAVGLAHAQQNRPFPTNLPTRFTTEVEANILHRGYTLQIKEYYDFFNDRVRIDTLRNGTRYVVIHDYRGQITYNTNVNERTCQAGNASASRVNPFRLLGNLGGAHLISVSDFFQIGRQYHDRYRGTAMIRGILCDHYQGEIVTVTPSGIYSNYTMQWYFARRENWTMPVGSHTLPGTAIPVRLDMVGISNGTRGPPIPGAPPAGIQTLFHNIYDFFNFRIGGVAQLTPDLFNPPPLVYCTGIPVTRDLPPIPNQFSLTSVFTDSNTNSTLTSLVRTLAHIASCV